MQAPGRGGGCRGTAGVKAADGGVQAADRSVRAADRGTGSRRRGAEEGHGPLPPFPGCTHLQ